ncbi:MAG: response regulator [bacterium]
MPSDFLVVDDSSVMRKIITKTIREAGYNSEKIHEAGDGKEALKVLKKQTVDLILCDWNMPTMDGMTFVTTLREDKSNSNSEVPIVMVTTEGSMGKIEEALDKGVNDYITKPFDADKLRIKLKKIFK